MTGVGLCLPQLGPGLTPELLREFCARVEAFGYTSLWVQDHFLWPLEPRRGYGGRPGAAIPEQYQSVLAPTELLAAVATWTSTARLGTSVLVAGNHWPAQLAGRLATIDVLSGGRLSVGLGVGWSAEEHDACGTDITTRGHRIDDFVPALVACWGDDPVSHEGPFFSIPPTIVRPKPVQQPRPPLLSGMWSEVGLERTRVHFDGWNPAGMPVNGSKAILDDLNARRPSGMAPLTMHHRAFAQYPRMKTLPGDPVERLAVEAAEAKAHHFEDFILEHNFWEGVAAPEAWLDVPEQFAPVVDAAT
ncbi:MAG: TIGR03619 family F420-dependent LLM class oxidoreductase [Ilumatobacteraceae bacterium]